jgi:hypothetical protein
VRHDSEDDGGFPLKQTNRRTVTAAAIAVAAVLMACGTNSTASRTPTAPAPTRSATVVATATPVTASTIQPASTVVASPASTSVPDLTPPPTPTPRPLNATPNALLSDVTLADAGTVIAMRVGQSFLLNLGSDGWSATVADQAIISRVINIAVVRGAQGVYLAHAAGRTTLDAIGPSPCPNAVPACGAPQRVFRVTIVVN